MADTDSHPKVCQTNIVCNTRPVFNGINFWCVRDSLMWRHSCPLSENFSQRGVLQPLELLLTCLHVWQFPSQVTTETSNCRVKCTQKWLFITEFSEKKTPKQLNLLWTNTAKRSCTNSNSHKICYKVLPNWCETDKTFVKCSRGCSLKKKKILI